MVRAIVRDHFEGDRAAHMMSSLTTVFALGPLLAPIIGGALLVRYGWHSIFLFIVFWSLVLLVAAWALLGESLREPDKNALQPVRILTNYLFEWSRAIIDKLHSNYGRIAVNGCRGIGPRSGDAEVVPPRVLKTACLCLIIATLFATSVERGTAQSVLSYHGIQDRSGNFVVPKLIWDNAQNMHLDESFRARISGHVYAQPLFWRVPGANSAMLLVATEDNVVYALDAQSGREIWRRALGKPIPRSSLSSGNISPLGITGTPVIDHDAQAIFLDSAIENESGQHHLVFGLALKDGSILQGWLVDVAQALAAQRIDFVSQDRTSVEH